MRKLYPDVSQMIKELSQSEVEKKELEQVIPTFSAIPQVQGSQEFQQRLRANLLEQARREKPGRVITFLRKMKPHYLSMGAVATIILAVTAVAGPHYFDLGKVEEIAKSNTFQAHEEIDILKRPEEANKNSVDNEKSLAIQYKAAKSEAAPQNSNENGRAAKAALPKPLLKQEPQIMTESFQEENLDEPQNEKRVQEKFFGPRSSVARNGLLADAVPGNLPKLPALSQEQAKSTTEASSALKIKLELKAPYPAAPKELWVYQPMAAPFSLEEIRILAAKFNVALPIVDEGEKYKVGDKQTYMEVSKTDGRVIYHNFNVEKDKGKISPAEARDLSSKFISEKGFVMTLADVEISDLPEKQLYQIRYIPVILGIQSPGQAMSIDISYSGSVHTLSYLRYTQGTAYKYPIITPAEAWEQLKTVPRYGSSPNTVLNVNNFKLVYHNFVQLDQKTQNFLQPAYAFSGLDNWGHNYELFVPAVKNEYFQQH